MISGHEFWVFQAASWGLLWRSRISCGVLYPAPEPLPGAEPWEEFLFGAGEAEGCGGGSELVGFLPSMPRPPSRRTLQDSYVPSCRDPSGHVPARAPLKSRCGPRHGGWGRSRRRRRGPVVRIRRLVAPHRHRQRTHYRWARPTPHPEGSFGSSSRHASSRTTRHPITRPRAPGVAPHRPRRTRSVVARGTTRSHLRDLQTGRAQHLLPCV